MPGSKLLAQVNHFIYLQTDNRQPFYIKYNNRIYSSSASGYLIVSKLKDGPVDFTVGFPKSDLPEQKFQCMIEKTDKGFLIKNFDNKGWVLYDLQSSVLTYANTATTSGANDPVIQQKPPAADDPFANMLSKITQDSSVKNVTVTKEQKVVQDSSLTIAKNPVTTQKPVQDVVKVDTPQVPAEVKVQTVEEPVWIAPAKSAVQQLRRFESKEGSDFVFEVVESAGQKDTIRLFIEKDTISIVSSPLVVNEAKKDTIVPEIKEKVAPPVDTITVKEEEKPIQEEVKQTEPEIQKTESKPLPNSNCKAIATEDDFLKLRRKMANESKDEAMLNEAKKLFKVKCFSTSQIKNLAVLFLNDEGRYRFYDAAALYVTDFANFKSLADTIQDEYYKKRFQALLPNQ